MKIGRISDMFSITDDVCLNLRGRTHCVGKHEMWMRFCVAHTDDKLDMHILNGDENSSEDHFHARTINKRPSSSMSLSRFGCEKGDIIKG